MTDQWIDMLSQWVENNQAQWRGDILFSGSSDISAYIKSFIQSYADVSTTITAIPPADMLASIHGFDTRDLVVDIYGWAYKDLLGIIDTHLPSDLQAILNIIEICDISSSIVGEWQHDQFDLAAEFYRIWNFGYKNLQASLHAWSTKDILAYINAVYYSDLGASIIGGLLSNLTASISPIPPAILQGMIHGLATVDLPTLLNGVYGPGDIQAYINAVRAADLQAFIGVYKGQQVPFDLSAFIVGGYSSDISAYIGGINPINLPAYIYAIQKIKDLQATIIPSVILMKKVILVPLLEHKDLGALINFMCFNSSYSNLNSYLHVLQKSDLSSFIIGWFGNSADNIKDLGAYINTEIYNTQDRITISYVPEVDKYTRLNLLYSVRGQYITWDTINVRLTNYYIKDLLSSITGVQTSSNLGASIKAVWDWNFSQLPDYVKPKTHEVFINIEQFEEQWRRFVELMFDRDGTTPFKYFYVSGTEQVYKVDRGRHWTIWAEGYNKVTNSMIDKANTRKKFVFKMTDYSTVDEAVRDILERAAYPTSANLAAYIDGGPSVYLDLHGSINVVGRSHRWIKHLRAEITGI